MSSSISTSSSFSSTVYLSGLIPSFASPALLSCSSLALELSRDLSESPGVFCSSCVFLNCFLCFILRFWNQVFTCAKGLKPGKQLETSHAHTVAYCSVCRTLKIEGIFFVFSWLTCVSERLSAVASSTRSGVERYRCISKRFSRPESCESEKTVRAFRRRQCFPGSSGWCWNNDGICTPLREKTHCIWLKKKIIKSSKVFQM